MTMAMAIMAIMTTAPIATVSRAVSKFEVNGVRDNADDDDDDDSCLFSRCQRAQILEPTHIAGVNAENNLSHPQRGGAEYGKADGYG